MPKSLKLVIRSICSPSLITRVSGQKHYNYVYNYYKREQYYRIEHGNIIGMIQNYLMNRKETFQNARKVCHLLFADDTNLF